MRRDGAERRSGWRGNRAVPTRRETSCDGNAHRVGTGPPAVHPTDQYTLLPPAAGIPSRICATVDFAMFARSALSLASVTSW